MFNNTLLNTGNAPRGLENHPWFNSTAEDWSRRLRAIVPTPPLTNGESLRAKMQPSRNPQPNQVRRVLHAAGFTQPVEACADDMLPSWEELRNSPDEALAELVHDKVEKWLQVNTTNMLDNLPSILMATGATRKWDIQVINDIAGVIIDLLNKIQREAFWNTCLEQFITKDSELILSTVARHILSRETTADGMHSIGQWLTAHQHILPSEERSGIFDAAINNPNLTQWCAYHLLILAQLQPEANLHTLVERTLASLNETVKREQWTAIWRGCLSEQAECVETSLRLTMALVSQQKLKLHPEVLQLICNWLTDILHLAQRGQSEAESPKLAMTVELMRLLCMKKQWHDSWQPALAQLLGDSLVATHFQIDPLWDYVPKSLAIDTLESALSYICCPKRKLAILNWCCQSNRLPQAAMRALLRDLLPYLRESQDDADYTNLSELSQQCFDCLWHDLWANEQLPSPIWVQYLAEFSLFWQWNQWVNLLKAGLFDVQKVINLDMQRCTHLAAFESWSNSVQRASHPYNEQLRTWLAAHCLPHASRPLAEIPETAIEALQPPAAPVEPAAMADSVMQQLETSIRAWITNKTRTARDLLLLLTELQSECCFSSEQPLPLFIEIVKQLTAEEYALLLGIFRNGSNKLGTPLLAALGIAMVNWRIHNMATIIEIADWVDNALVREQPCFTLKLLVAELMTTAAFEWLEWRPSWESVLEHLLVFEPTAFDMHKLRLPWISAVPRQGLAAFAQAKLCACRAVDAPLAKLELLEALNVWDLVSTDLIQDAVGALLRSQQEGAAAASRLAYWSEQCAVKAWLEALAQAGDTTVDPALLAALANKLPLWDWSLWRDGIKGKQRLQYLGLLEVLLPLVHPLSPALAQQFSAFICSLFQQRPDVWKQIESMLISTCRQRPDLIHVFAASATKKSRENVAKRIDHLQACLADTEFPKIDNRQLINLSLQLDKYFASKNHPRSSMHIDRSEQSNAAELLTCLRELTADQLIKLIAKDPPLGLAATVCAIEDHLKGIIHTWAQLWFDADAMEYSLEQLDAHNSFICRLVAALQHADPFWTLTGGTNKHRVQHEIFSNLAPTLKLYTAILSQNWLSLIEGASCSQQPHTLHLNSLETLERLETWLHHGDYTATVIKSIWTRTDTPGSMEHRIEICGLYRAILEIAPTTFIDCALERNAIQAMPKILATNIIFSHLCLQENISQLITVDQLTTLLSINEWSAIKYFRSSLDTLITVQQNLLRIHEHKAFINIPELEVALTLFHGVVAFFDQCLNGLVNPQESPLDRLEHVWERSKYQLMRHVAACLAYASPPQQLQQLLHSCNTMQKLLLDRVELHQDSCFCMLQDFIKQPQSCPNELAFRWVAKTANNNSSLLAKTYEAMLISILDYSIGNNWAKSVALAPLLACWQHATRTVLTKRSDLPQNSRLCVLLEPGNSNVLSTTQDIYTQIQQEIAL